MGKGQTAIVPADADGIARAARALTDGGIVALPTETVYGLAARADSTEAVAAIYRAKGRPDFNPLIVHVGSLEQAELLAHFDQRARDLAARFWPGPLTLVLPRREQTPLASAVTAGLPTVAIRCPAHPVMRAVLGATGLPLAAPSANRSGAVSPTTAGHVAMSLEGRIGLILDGGYCPAGIESTIVAIRPQGWALLRPGPIAVDEIAATLNEAADTETNAKVEAPGQLASHYSPGKPVRLDAIVAEADEFHIGFGTVAGDVTLSASGDLAEAAVRLYEALHRAASQPKPRVAIAPIPAVGMGLAINDRLKRAAF